MSETHLLIDEGLSGTTMERPGLRRLRELVQTQAIAAVITYDVDRLSRNLGHQLLLAEEFERARVTLLIVSYPIEQGPEGRLFFNMRGALAEYEREKTRERTKRGRHGRAQKGHVWGGQVPLGYHAIREPHKARWEIEEAEAPIVRRIFAMCLEGKSTYAITKQLSEERLPTRGNGRRVVQPGIWRASTIHRMLTNEAYAGVTYFNKHENLESPCTGKKTRRRPRPREEWQAIAVPAIIDRETFDAAQRQLDYHREASPRNRKRDYLLTGNRLRCGRCGRAMSGGAYPTANGITRRYRCASLSHIMDPAGRCYGQLKADDVEPQLWDAVLRVLEQPELIAAEVQRQEATADDQRAEIHRELTLIDAALAKCDREAQRWADAYAAEVINLAELKGYRAEIEARRQSLLAQQATCQARLEAIGQHVGQVGALIDYCARVRERLQTFDEAEKRLALDALDIRVTWTPGQPLTIEGSIPIDIVPIAP